MPLKGEAQAGQAKAQAQAQAPPARLNRERSDRLKVAAWGASAPPLLRMLLMVPHIDRYLHSSTRGFRPSCSCVRCTCACVVVVVVVHLCVGVVSRCGGRQVVVCRKTSSVRAWLAIS